MKIVPLTKKTVKCKLEGYNPNVLFEIKVFDMTEYIRFKELAIKTVSAKDESLFAIYQELIDMAVVDVTGFDGDELRLEPFMYEALCNKITEVNQVTSENVKK